MGLDPVARREHDRLATVVGQPASEFCCLGRSEIELFAERDTRSLM
jgi:hypothetical protein